MSIIKINDLNENMTITEQDLENVKGGPIFMQYDGVDGSVTAAGHEKWIELNSVQFNRQGR